MQLSVPWLNFLCAQEGSSAREKVESFIKDAKLTAPERAALRKFGCLLDKEVKAIAAPMEAAVEEARLLEIHKRLLDRGSSISMDELRKNSQFWSNQFVERLEDVDRRMSEAFPSAAFDRIRSIVQQ